MATITTSISLTVPNMTQAEIVNRLCIQLDYNPTMPDGSPNPQSKADFIKADVSRYLKNHLKRYDANIASKLASDNAETAITYT